MRANPLGGLALVLLGVAGAHAADPNATDEARFDYTQGFAASGSFTGSCRLAGILFPQATPAELTLHAHAARLDVYETWINETLLLEPRPYGAEVLPTQTVHRHNLTGTDIRVAWGSNAHVALSREAITEWGRIQARFDGAHWTAGPPAGVFGTGAPNYHEVRHGEMIVLEQALWGPGAIVETDGPLLAVTGDGFLKLDEATVESSGFRLELPPFRQVLSEDRTPVLLRRSVVETYAVLVLTGLDALIPSGVGSPVCMELEWDGTGVVTYHNAVGRAARGAEEHAFARKELTLNGTFSSRERTLVPGDHLVAPARVSAHAAGRFEALGLDFAAVVLPPADSLPLEALGFWALVAAFAALGLSKLPNFAAFLYSRIRSDQALAHPLRSLIHAAAQASPGLILADVVRSTERPYAVVRHHAYVLEHLGLVKTIRRGKALHLFPSEASLPQARRALLLERDMAVRRLCEFAAGAGMEYPTLLRALADEFHMSRVGAWKALRRAEKANLVLRSRVGEGVWVRAIA